MSDMTRLIICILLPFFGTTLGAATVFIFKNGIGDRTQKALLGFASGVMIAASVWSLLIPGMDMAEEAGKNVWAPAVIGFLLGIGFLLALDTFVPHLHVGEGEPEGCSCKRGKSFMLVMAVTLHNIPEGMAVGVVFAGLLSGSAPITLAGAMVLALGIAIQNFPEGAIISTPLTGCGMSKWKSFGYGAMSGVVEPLSAVLTIFLSRFITPVLPYILSFAAGAMMYVVIEELIPESQSGSHSNIGTIGAAIGFALMMFLDVALG